MIFKALKREKKRLVLSTTYQLSTMKVSKDSKAIFYHLVFNNLSENVLTGKKWLRSL